MPKNRVHQSKLTRPEPFKRESQSKPFPTKIHSKSSAATSSVFWMKIVYASLNHSARTDSFKKLEVKLRACGGAVAHSKRIQSEGVRWCIEECDACRIVRNRALFDLILTATICIALSE